MDDYVSNLVQKAKDNTYFRQVLETGNAMQVVIMSLNPGEDIGTEVHEGNEQVLICLSGSGKVVIDGSEQNFQAGDMVLVRAGQQHNFVNGNGSEMKIITIYSPPHHADGVVHQTKNDAETDESDHA